MKKTILALSILIIILFIGGCNIQEEITVTKENVQLENIGEKEKGEIISTEKEPEVNIVENGTKSNGTEELLLSQTNRSDGGQYLFVEGNIQAQNYRFNFSEITKALFFSNLPMRSNKNPQSHVILHIREDNFNGKEVSNLTKEMKNIKDNNWTEWDFPDVNIDKNKEYYFIFECPDCVYVLCAGWCESKNEIISFEYQKSNVYSEGNYWYKGIETDDSIEPEYDWDLAFKIYGIK
jgi:hypothetical protein